MTTRKLTVWAPDGDTFDQLKLASLEIGEIRSCGWDWNRFHIDLLKSLEKGSAPDIIEVGTTWTNRLAREGVLLNITQLANERLYAASTFFPHTLYSCKDAVQIDQYFALPLLADIRILFYNVDYLNIYLANHPNAFRNWNAFREMCEILKEQFPRRVIAWPLGKSGAFHDCLPWVWAAGGDFVSPSYQILLDSRRTQEAIFRLARLILTDCVPLPPDHLIDGLVELRAKFLAGGIGIIAGTLWMTQIPGWQGRFKAVLHPPNLFSAAFVGGSNIAIVRKHGDNENAEAYDLAKEFLESAVNIDNQIRLSKGIGKLPCNISAWEQMKLEEKDEDTRKVLEAFDKALCYTVDRSMPNLLNFAQIEEELKACIETIWENVGEIKRASPDAPLERLESKCRVMIHQELTKARKQIEKFFTDYTVQYTKQEVEEIGITPPGQFDLWLEVTSNTPTVRGKVYVAGRGEIQTGVGAKPFQILLALVNAPQRMLSQEKLLEDVWGHKSISDHKRMDDVISSATQLSTLVKLLKESLETSPNQLLKEIQKRRSVPPYSTIVSLLETRGKWEANFSLDHFRFSVCDIIAKQADEIKDIADNSNRAQAIDTLRVTCRELNKKLGPIRNKPIINHSKQEAVNSYCLPEDLSICLAVP